MIKPPFNNPAGAFTTVPRVEMLISGEGSATKVVAVALLLALAGSGWLANAAATFDSVPVVGGAVTRIVIVAVLPMPSAPTMQVTVPVSLQLPWLGTAETKVTPDGNVSATVTPLALDGPLLATVIV
jgi:hypothetical protein